MPTFDNYKNKPVAVFGLGKAGQASIDLLLKSGAEVFAWDDNQKSIDELKGKYKNVKFAAPEEYDWKKINALVLSPGIPFTFPKPHKIVSLAQKNKCPVICDIELLYKAAKGAKFVGITGTNGKSTTTALIGHVLKFAGKKVEVGGNIGVAASKLPIMGKDGIYVIEVSSYQLDLLRETKFDIALLLNITPDHIDRHGDMDGYVAAKLKIFDRQTKSDIAVIAVDDEHTQYIAKQVSKSKVVRVSNISSSADISIKAGKITDGKKVLNIGIPERLPGEHNAQNIVAAYAALSNLGLDDKTIKDGIHTFPGLSHRIEYVAIIDGIKFINDSKATNAFATEKALLSFDNIYWIAGGLPKEGGIEALDSLFPKIKHAFLIGQAEQEFAKTLDGKVAYTRCGSLEKAIKAAYESAKKAKEKTPIVLLSPACASFDQFKNFEHRGEEFSRLVRQLKGSKSAA